MRRSTRIQLVIFVFIFQLIIGCDLLPEKVSPTNETPAITPTSTPRPVQAVDKKCLDSLDQPVHLYIYAYKSKEQQDQWEKQWDWKRLGYITVFEGKLLYDSNKSKKPPVDLSDDMDNLASKGYGAWDGCYGAESEKRILTFRIHYLPAPGDNDFCGWQGKSYAETLMMDKCLSPTAYTHEITHAIVDRTLGLDAPGAVIPSTRSEAIYEALSDIFAVIISDPDNSYSVDKTTGIYRNLADPASTGQVINLDDYSSGKSKYINSGIFSHAAYLLMDVRRAEGTPPEFSLEKYPVQPIGKEKVGEILFHSLSPTFVKHLTSRQNTGKYTFEEMAAGVIAACDDLIVRKPDDIKDTDCVQVKMAFCSVGILSDTECSDTNLTPVTETTEPPASTPSTSSRLLYLAKQVDGSSTLMETDPFVIDPKVIYQTNEEVRSFKISASDQIVVETGPVNHPTLSLIGMDGRPVELFSNDVGFMVYNFSPDGTFLSIQYLQPRELMGFYKSIIINLVENTNMELRDTQGQLVWAPNGRMIAFQASKLDKELDYGIYVFANKDFLNPRRLVPKLDDVRPFAWSPDSQTVYYSTFSPVENPRDGVYSIGWSGASMREIVLNNKLDGTPSALLLSPDGQWISFATNSAQSHPVWIMRSDGSQIRKIAEVFSDFDISWSPDGKYLAFLSLPGSGSPSVQNGNAIWITAADGSSTRQITPGILDHNTQIAWSPDGQYLSFLGRAMQDPGNLNLDVFTVDIIGGEPVNVSQSPDTNEYYLIWWR
jgi:hypothetical protein